MSRGRPREFDIDEALDAAMALFWQHGYEGTSLSALSAAMKINMPSLYAAFGNKESLFKKVLDRYIQKPASYLPNALKQPTARRCVQTLFAGAVNLAMEQKRPTGCMLVQGALTTGPTDARIREEMAQRRKMAEQAVRMRFERAIVEGDLPASSDAGKLARFVLTVLWGISVQAVGGATREELSDVAEMAMQRFPGRGRATQPA
jgi:AcrR family transcriptional regulator